MRICSLILTFGLLALAGGCGSGERRQLLADAPGITLQFTDAYGQQLALRQAPTRIVSLSPNQTHILFAIGAGSRLVGRSETSTTPDEALSVMKIITFPELNGELVSNLRPDCILLATEDFANADTIRDVFTQGGIPVLVQRYGTLAHLYANIRTLGALTDHAAGAEAYATKLQTFVDSLRARTAPTVKYGTVVLRQINPPVVAAGQSFMNEMIGIAGGNNLFASMNAPYIEILMDTLIARRPELLFLPPGPPDQLNDLVSQYPRLASIPAVANGQVYELDVERYQNPGPLTPEGLLKLTASLHANVGAPLLYESIFGPVEAGGQ